MNDTVVNDAMRESGDDTQRRRRNVRRWTIALVIVVLAFYVGFILSGVFKAG